MRVVDQFIFTNQVAPATPASGQVAAYSKSSDRLYWKNSAGVEFPVEAGIVFPFSYTGTLVVGVGKFRVYNDTGDTLTIRAVRITVNTAPTGATIICDISKGTGTGASTTIFTTQTNRPTIAISGFTSGKVTNMDVTSFPDGDYLSVDIDQIGSTIAGADLTAQILC